MYGTKEFSDDVIRLFGKDVPFIVEDEGLLHPQMGFLACAIEEGVSCKDDILCFIENLLGRKDLHPEIENAVCISFVELEKFKELNIPIPSRIQGVLSKYQGRANAT